VGGGHNGADVSAKGTLEIVQPYEGVFRALGLSAEGVFDDPRIKVWRSVTERQNCTLDVPGDVEGGDGKGFRLHVKRYWPVRGVRGTPAAEEVGGIRALERAGIASVPLVAIGELPDGRSFVITEDLAGYRPADKLIAEGGASFEMLLEPTAAMAARLHNAGLHHRDLYLCHFFARLGGQGGRPELRLIDAARVRALPRFLTRRRWIVKDLAQFWYSTLALAVTDEQRERWMADYSARRTGPWAAGLGAAVGRKARGIGRHDAKLRLSQPKRNVSLGA
jgi:hypothetical protein